YFFPYGNHTDFLAPLKALSPLFEAMLYRFKSIGLPTLFHDEPTFFYYTLCNRILVKLSMKKGVVGL
ncbi:MAG: hypothetical protein AB1325_03340, partial [Nitrospirota bacterium]